MAGRHVGGTDRKTIRITMNSKSYRISETFNRALRAFSGFLPNIKNPALIQVFYRSETTILSFPAFDIFRVTEA